jgi:hypothetical protein
VGRSATEAEKAEKGSKVVLKDNDWLALGKKLQLSSSHHTLLLKQIERDCAVCDFVITFRVV